MDNLFSTHPNTENRIAELEKCLRKVGPITAEQRAAIADAGISRYLLLYDLRVKPHAH